MKTFILFITSSPSSSRQVHRALSFAKQIVASGHQLEQIFFYSEAVSIASSQLIADSNKFNLHNQWLAFAKDTNLSLKVCVTASIKRGILAKEEAELHNIQSNLKAPFEQVGMTEFFALLKRDDIKMVQF